jgi:two-component system response regulator AtoC
MSEPIEKPKLLIVDDEENMRHMLSAMIGRFDYAVETAADGRQALAMVKAKTYAFVLCDIKMPKMDGLAFLRAAADVLGSTTVIMMSAYGTIDIALEAMKAGAYDYISKPFKSEEIYLTLKKAEERERLKSENQALRRQIRRIGPDGRFGTMVAKSRAMEPVLRMAERAAAVDSTVLITGESGTGKELVARAIHYSGKRADKPLVAVNCGGIPENLLESEFFGFRKGAFTGADHDRRGLFEEADKGTLFLDEIGELPLALQVKLLRVLQEGEIRPLGATAMIRVKLRIIAATARNLEALAADGRFRQDLFYRLNVLPIHLPPLRERPEDIPLLIAHFMDDLNQRLGRQVRGISPEAMALLFEYQWPGNVRELENFIERAIVLTCGDEILPAHLPFACAPLQPTAAEGLSLKSAQRTLEKDMIARALEATGGNRTQAARILEISHPSLLKKIKQYDLK